MLSAKTQKMKLAIWAIFLLIFFAYILAINFKTPLMGEDYSLVEADLSQELIIRLREVFYKINLQIGWEFKIGDIIEIFLSAFGKDYFNVINTVVIISYFLCVFTWANLRLPSLCSIQDLIIFFVPVFAIWICSPFLGDVFFWFRGGSNYLWSVTFMMIICFPVRLALDERKIKFKNGLFFLAYLILFGLVGIFDRSVVIFVILLSVVVLSINFFRKKKLKPIWLFLCILAIICTWYIISKEVSGQGKEVLGAALRGKELTLADIIAALPQKLGDIIVENQKVIYMYLFFSGLRYFMKDENCIEEELNGDRFLIFISLFSALLDINSQEEGILPAFIFQTMVIVAISRVFYLSIEQNGNFYLKKIFKIMFGSLALASLVISVKMLKIYDDYYRFIIYRDNLNNARHSNNRFLIAKRNNIKNRFLNNREDYLYSLNEWGGNRAYANYWEAEETLWTDRIVSDEFVELDIRTKEDNRAAYANIEYYNGELLQEIELDRGSVVEIKGWAIDELRKVVPSKVFAKIGELYIEMTQYYRPDVAEYYKDLDYANSGIYLTFEAGKFNSGVYDIKIYGLDAVDNCMYLIKDGMKLTIR